MLCATLTGVDAAVASLERALGAEIRSALGDIQRAVAASAVADHPYQDRTGTLTGSIGPGDVSGTFADDSLQAEVVADTGYASYLDDRTQPYTRQDGGLSPPFAFLLPAFERQDDDFSARLDRAIREAVASAGWAES
jgi:hypothetical protein